MHGAHGTVISAHLDTKNKKYDVHFDIFNLRSELIHDAHVKF